MNDARTTETAAGTATEGTVDVTTEGTGGGRSALLPGEDGPGL